MLITQKEFERNHSRTKIPLECEFCHCTFHKNKNSIQMGIKKTGGHTMDFCSLKCFGMNKTEKNTKIINCNQCNKSIRKPISWITENNFCNRSCSATYNNTHKTKGYRRSKLEVWIEKQLTELYPDLEIHFNKTDAINAELDVYIPSLKIAFEFNGIFHYEPIYGENKLKRTIDNDKRKFQLCLENGISLCIIDTHNVKYLKKERDQKFLDIIKSIVGDVNFFLPNKV